MSPIKECEYCHKSFQSPKRPKQKYCCNNCSAKGRTQTEQRKKNISEGVRKSPPSTIYKKGEHPSPKTEFTKGFTPWNKGIKTGTSPSKGKSRPHTQQERASNWKGGITPKLQQRCSELWWRELRVIIYKRDNWTCQMCSKRGGALQCHHMVSEVDGGNHEPENLITLCRVCHSKLDALNRRHRKRAEK